jgi:hypothetical protein
MTSGQWAWTLFIVFELLATAFKWETASMAWWTIGRSFWWFRWLVGPAAVTWLWFHLTLPMFR